MDLGVRLGWGVGGGYSTPHQAVGGNYIVPGGRYHPPIGDCYIKLEPNLLNFRYYDISWTELDITKINLELSDFQNRCRKLPKGTRIIIKDNHNNINNESKNRK